MATTKTLSEMSLAELEKALTGAKERLTGMETELADYRKSVQSYVLEFGKRQRQFEKAFGMVSAGGGDHVGNGRGGGSKVGNSKRGPRGNVSNAIVTILGKASKPMGVEEIFSASGSKSKPSVAQTLMRLVQAGKVHRYNKDGKTIGKNDSTQRAKSYALA